MALKFGPQWLRDLTDDGTGQVQTHTPSYGVKFKLADYRYGREEMLALYSDTHSPPDQVRKHQVIFSKENQRPISMTPLSEDEQRLISQGINSHVVLRGGRGGGVAERGRGRGRGRGDGAYVPRQSENGEQPFARQQSNDGWELVGRKPERSFSRGYEEQAPTKREFLRSSSNNWRDRKMEAEEEESNSPGGHWRPNREGGSREGGSREGVSREAVSREAGSREAGSREGVSREGVIREGVNREGVNREGVNREGVNRWGSSRSNWRHATGDFDETRPYKPRDPDSALRGPRRTSDSYDNEVPEWVDDIGDDPGTFDSRGIFVATKKGSREHHNQDTQRPSIEEHRKKHNDIDNRENRDPEKPRPMSGRAKAASKSIEDHEIVGSNIKAPQKSDTVKKPEPDYITHSMKGDGDSLHAGLIYSEKNTNGPQAPPGPAGGIPDPLYHPQSHPTETVHIRQESSNQLDQRSSISNAQSENVLRMEKSLQNLLAGMTANVETKTEEEVDVSKALPLTHKDANKWFYRDPQGKIQGPFSSESMAEWFRIGYFTMNLIVKRGCDDSFKELGELIKQYGRVPFVPGPPLPPLITNTSLPEEIPTSVPEIPSNPLVMTMPSMVNPIMPGMMGPTMPSLHDRFMFRSMMLQQEYLKQQLLMQQLQMQTMAKLQEQESFKDYTPDQQHDIAMRMMMQTNPLLMQQMQQLQHQQMLLQQQQQQLQQPDIHSTLGGLGGAGAPESFQHPISLPSMHNTSTAVPTPIPSATVQNPNPVSEQEAAAPVWANNSQHTENSIWSQPSQVWNMDNMNEKSQAYKMQMESMKREREEEKLKEEERLKQELIETKQEELRKQQNEIQRQREQMRREKEEMEKERLKKLEEVRREEQRIAQLENERHKKEQMEHQMRLHEEKKRHEEEKKKRDQENKKQEEKRRKEEEKIKEQKRKEEARRAKEAEDLRRQQEKEAAEARQKEEMQRQLELQQIQEEEERIKRESAESEKQQQAFKKQLEMQKHQESLRKLQQAQKEQLANMQLPASSNWAKHASQGNVSHSKSLTQIQEEEARREKERQKEQQAFQQKMQEHAAIIQQQQTQNQKSWASQVSKGISHRGPSLLDIQQQEMVNAKKAEKERGKAQSHQAKQSLATSLRPNNTTGLWGTNSTWESSGAPPPVSTGGIWDMGVPMSVKKQPQQQPAKNGLAASSIPGLPQQQQQQQQQAKKDAKSNKKAAAPKQKEVETVQKLFHNKKQDGFSSWVTEKLSRFSSVIDIPTFVSFIVEVDSPHDVLDYVKTYLGDTKETQEFSRQFLEKRNQCKNQMRLQKQLEEDSIWGPAPAINPHTSSTTTTTSSSDSFKAGNKEAGQASKSKNKKKKKSAAAQKIDSSILGFTVTADPNRRNASGEFETID